MNIRYGFEALSCAQPVRCNDCGPELWAGLLRSDITKVMGTIQASEGYGAAALLAGL